MDQRISHLIMAFMAGVVVMAIPFALVVILIVPEWKHIAYDYKTIAKEYRDQIPLYPLEKAPISLAQQSEAGYCK